MTNTAAPPPAPGPRPATPPAVIEVKSGPGYLVRAVWFILVGWWLTAIVSAIAWFATVTIIGLPLGIWLINRIPTVLTLRPRTSYQYTYTDGTGAVWTGQSRAEQVPWPIRGLWFIVLGWWASGIIMSVAWILAVLIITLPISLWLYNRVPFVASLYRY
jgi:uncharacterized membrane protein YccF (DUF307 family)